MNNCISILNYYYYYYINNYYYYFYLCSISLFFFIKFSHFFEKFIQIKNQKYYKNSKLVVIVGLLFDHESSLLLEEALQVVGSFRSRLILLFQLLIGLVLFGQHGFNPSKIENFCCNFVFNIKD